MAINGVGTTITELFRLAESGPGAPVSIDYYDWRILDTPRRVVLELTPVKIIIYDGMEGAEAIAREGVTGG